MEEQQHEPSVKAVCAKSPNTHTQALTIQILKVKKRNGSFARERRTVTLAARVLFIVTDNMSEDCQILSKMQPTAVQLLIINFNS